MLILNDENNQFENKIRIMVFRLFKFEAFEQREK
jgi:hypothetical protein